MAWNESEHPRDKDGKFTNGAPESSEARRRRIREKYFPHLRKRSTSEGSKQYLTKKQNSDKLKLSLNFFARTPEEQFGKKVGKHAKDFGLDPSKTEDRLKFIRITEKVLADPDEIRKGFFRGQAEDVLFYAKGDIVVMTKLSGEYISTLKGGVNNARFKDAIRQKK